MSTITRHASEEIRSQVKEFGDTVRSAVAQVVVGMDAVVDQFLIALLAGGHVLLEGVPGTAKTTLAKCLAHVLGLEYHRVQFTPDLLPSDITGTYVFDRKTNDFALRQGPLFCQLLLADEVNRSPAKTQAALLEAMQENQVTIEGTTMSLPSPFMVLATQNPIEQEGVYRLPEAQLDRFLMRISMGYPDRKTEVEMLELHGGMRDADSPAGRGIALPEARYSTEAVLRMQGYLGEVYAEPGILHYVVDLARASRENLEIALGASPRASLVLLQCAKGRALLQGRHYCTHEDIHEVLQPSWGHRLILRPEAEIEGRQIRDVIADLLQRVPVLKAAAK